MAEARAATPRAPVAGMAVPLWRLGNAALVVGLVLAVLVNSGGLSYTNYRVSHLVLGALIAGYGLSLLVRRKLPGPTVLDVPIAALLFVNAVALALSPYPGVSLEPSLEIAAIVVTFYALADAVSLDVRTIVRAFVLIGALLAVFGIMGFVLLYADDLALKKEVLGSLGAREWLPKWYRPKVFYHPNILASAMDLALPFALALTIYARSRAARVLAVGAFSLCLVTLVMTNSRGAWLGLMVALPAFFLLTCSSGQGVDVQRMKRWVLQHKGRAGIVLGGAGLCGSVFLAALWVVHPAWLFRSTAGSRFDLVRGALHLIVNRPILGYGPDAPMGLLFPSYNLDHPHNLYLDIVLGSGFVGLAVALVFGWVACRMLWRALQQQTPERRAIAAACVAALLSLLVHGLVDVPTRATGFVLLAAVVLAIAVRLADLRLEANRTVSYLARGAVVAIIPLCLLAWQQSDSAQTHFAQSQSLAAQGSLAGAASEAERAASLSQGSIAYQVNAGVIEVLAYQQSVDPGQSDTKRLDRAIAYFNRARTLDNRSTVAYANLAQAERLAGNKNEAAAAANKALEFAPYNSFLKMLKDPSIAISAGNVLEWAGQDEAAVSAYAEAIRVDPSVAASAYWSTSPERTQLRQQALDLADVSPCLIGRSVALYGTSNAELPELISRCRVAASTGADHAALAIMLEADGQHDEALQQARTALGKYGSAEAHTALGYVEAPDDLMQARRDFLAGDMDGLLLLSLTYETGVASPPNTAALQTSQALPAALEKQIRADVSRQPSRVGYAYFLDQLRLAPPDTTLIPGEWLDLVPPRIRLEQAIVAASE